MLSKVISNKLNMRHVNHLFKYRFSRSTQKSNKLNKEDFVEIVSEQEYTYTPKDRIQFNEDGVAPIFLYEDFIYGRFAYYLLMLTMGGLCSFSLKKLWNWNQRRWFGVIFYTFLSLYMIQKTYRANLLFSKIVIQIDLQQCGRKINLYTPKYLFLKQKTTHDISTISKPINSEQNMQLSKISEAFPVLINGDCYFLFRSGLIIQKEIMPVIMNAKYINTNY